MKLRFFLIILSTLGVLLIGEFIGANYFENKMLSKAVLDWRNAKAKIQECFTLSDNLGFEPIWGKCGYPSVLKVGASTNKNVLSATTANTFRILILGDSNTYRGFFDNILKNMLTEIFHNKINIEVTKIGIESYNTHQEVKLLRDKLSEFDPDLLIMQFTPNDFEFTPAVVRIGNKIYYFSTNGEKNMTANKDLFKMSSLYRIYVLNRLIIKEKDLAVTEAGNTYWQEKIKTMDKTLDDFNHFIRNKKIESVFLIYPVFADEQWNEPREAILKLLSDKDIEHIDLIKYTEDLGGPLRFQSKEEDEIDMIHPIREFDGIVADTLANYVVSNKDKFKQLEDLD